MGRKAYFPDTMLHKSAKPDAVNQPISTIKSDAIQSGRVGGSCYVLAPFKALLLKKGPDALKNIITDDENDKTKAVVHFYYKGEPYDITIDKTVINESYFHDFSKSSDDIRMIMKAFMLAGFYPGYESVINDRYEKAKYDEATKTYKNETEPHSITQDNIPNGGSPMDIMNLLSPETKNTGLQFIKDTSEAINEQSDLETALLKKFDELLKEPDTIVCLGRSLDPYGNYVHAVTLTGVDLASKRFIYYDQKQQTSLNPELADDIEPKSRHPLMYVFSYKLDKNNKPVEYSQINVKDLVNVITEKKTIVSEKDALNSLRSKFINYCKEKNRKELETFAKDFPQYVDQIIKEASAKNHITWNNAYELNKYLYASSHDEAQKDNYDRLQKMLDDTFVKTSELYPKHMAVSLFREKFSSLHKDEWKDFIDEHTAEVDKLIGNILSSKNYSWKNVEEINAVLASTVDQEENHNKLQTVLNGTLEGINQLYMQYNTHELLKQAFQDKFLNNAKYPVVWADTVELNKDKFNAIIDNIIKSGNYSWDSREDFNNTFNASANVPEQQADYEKQQTILKSMMFQAKELYDTESAAVSASIKVLNPKGEPLAYAYAKLVTAHSMKVPTSIISTKWNAVMKVTGDITDCVNQGIPVSAELRQQAYNACRIYLDDHTDNSQRQDSIDGQHFSGGRLRKAAVVNYLKEMSECACLEGFDNMEKLYREHCAAKKIEYHDLDFNKLESSLAAHVPQHIAGNNQVNTQKAYAELNAETSRKLTQWKADRAANKNAAARKNVPHAKKQADKKNEKQQVIANK